MTGDSVAERRRFSYEWARYELGALHLVPPTEEALNADVRSSPYESLGIMEAWYLGKNCFLEDNFILKRLSRMPDVPTYIVQGRYDMICPPVTAYRLKSELEKLGYKPSMQMVVAGHSSSDPEIRKHLVRAADELADILR